MGTLLISAVATLVFCAPGYPGGAGDAQPFLDQFAATASAAAGWPAGSLAAVYDPTESGGLAKLASPEAALAFVPYPFFVQHGAERHLIPLVQADMAGIGTTERWTLVAKTGSVTGQASLSGYTVLSVAGYAPDFVRRSILPTWPLAPDVVIEPTGQILSALRRAAAGDHVVALLDQTQAAALPTLPFAAQLTAVMQSNPLPIALVAVVDDRLTAARVRALRAALLTLGHSAAEADTLGQLHLKGFVPPQLPGRAAAR